MVPHAMPDAPAPAVRLSRTRMSAPPPSPRARSSRPRCQAVERPWMPAPMITYRLCVGTMDPPFRFPGPAAIDLDAEIVADRHKRQIMPGAGRARVVLPDAGSDRPPGMLYGHTSRPRPPREPP